MFCSFDFLPIIAIEVWEVRITGEFRVHNGEIDMRGSGQGLAIKAGPSDNKYFFIISRSGQCRFNRARDDKSFGIEAWIVADD